MQEPVSTTGRVSESTAPIVEQLQEFLGDDEWGEVRNAAAEALAPLGMIGLEALSTALSSGGPHARNAAAHGLGCLGAAASDDILALLVAALHDVEQGVRMSAAGSLGKLGSQRAVEPLGRALQDENFEVRAAVVTALGKIGGPDAMRHVVSGLRDAHGMVVRVSIETLRTFDDAAIIDPLLPMLADEGDTLCEEAAKTLASLGERAVAALTAVLNRGNSKSRQWAAFALGRTRDPKAFHPLKAALSDPDAEVRGRAAQALGALGDTSAFDALVPLVDDPDRGVRNRALQALGESGDARAFDLLLGYLGSDDFGLAYSVFAGLGALGNPRAMKPLLDELGRRDFGHQAAFAIVRLSSSGLVARAALLEALSDPRGPFQCYAVEGLGYEGSPEAFDALVNLLHKSDLDMRWRIVVALSHHDETRSVPILIEALTNSDKETRFVAAQALGSRGEQGDTSVVEPLIGALKDLDNFVRYFTTWHLGRIGDERALPALMELERSDTSVIPVYPDESEPTHAIKDAAARAVKLIQIRMLVRSFEMRGSQ